MTSDAYVGIVGIISSLIILFVMCNIATKVTTSSFIIAHDVYQLNWYNYPTKYQLYFKLIMRRAQRPIVFNGHGMISCQMETFLLVK